MKFTCQKCGHSWTPRVAMPGVCPKCHCAKWYGDEKYPRKAIMTTYKCLRCGAEWRGNKSTPPKQCGICHSILWNTPRKNRYKPEFMARSRKKGATPAKRQE